MASPGRVGSDDVTRTRSIGLRKPEMQKAHSAFLRQGRQEWLCRLKESMFVQRGEWNHRWIPSLLVFASFGDGAAFVGTAAGVANLE